MDQIKKVERLNYLKLHFHESAAAIAQKAGISESNYNKMLKGTQKITDKTLKKISDAWGISFEWLLTGEGDMLKSCEGTVTQQNEQGDNLNDSIKIVGGSQDWFDLINKKNEQIDRLLAIIERMQDEK